MRQPLRREAMWLAAQLRYVNVDAMLHHLTLRQFYEWIAYRRMDPFGQDREDLNFALLRQLTFNVAVKSEHREVSVKKFLLDFDTPAAEPAVESLQSDEIKQRLAHAYVVMQASMQES